MEVAVSSETIVNIYQIIWRHVPEGSNIHRFLFLVSWGGVRLSPFGTSPTNWPVVPAPDDG
jgi:hypothetical protein